MNNNRRMLKVLKLLVNLLVIYVLLFAPSHAYAASWNISSQGDCYNGYPRGASTLYWEGYSPLAWGKSWGWLWYWTGSSWSLTSSGYGDASGASNAAIADDSASYQEGWWTQTGGHRASFFSGQNNSYGNQFTCPE
jgi:hypothetical protein